MLAGRGWQRQWVLLETVVPHTIDHASDSAGSSRADGAVSPPRPSDRALRIVPWDPALRVHFHRLNADWLQRYFEIEPVDHEVLSNPEQRIIEPGGHILFAVLGDEVVGTCALLHEAPGVYELTKMAVAEPYQGLGIGRRLLVEVIATFRAHGGVELFLESNSRLEAALHLYASLGFERQAQTRPGSHYARADVYMIWRAPSGV